MNYGDSSYFMSYRYLGRQRSLEEIQVLTGLSIFVLRRRAKDGFSFVDLPCINPDANPIKKSVDRGQIYNFNGESLTLKQWAERTGIAIITLYTRIIRRRWSIEKALTKPIGQSQKAKKSR